METDHPTRHYVPTPAVRQAVQDAQHLLAYAVESKLSVADDIISALVQAKNVLRQDAWSPDEETLFWRAFTCLNALVKPVTVRSLKTVSPPPDSSFWQRLMTRGNMFLFFYGLLTLGVFILMVVLQTYWFIGNGLIQEIDELTEQRNNLLQIEYAIRERTPDASSREATMLEEPEELANLNTQLQANYIALLKWSAYWKIFLVNEHSFEGKNVLLNARLIQQESSRLQRKIDTDRGLLQNVSEEQKSAISLRIEANQREQFRLSRELQAERLRYQTVITKLPSQFVLEMLQSYILPMLFGLLGAAIYVLRSATREIEQVTYTMGSDIRYELRLALGGLGIGWFLVPEDVTGLLRALSPLVLSFAVGYNIEVFFSLMDSIIDTLAKPSEEAK